MICDEDDDDDGFVSNNTIISGFIIDTTTKTKLKHMIKGELCRVFLLLTYHTLLFTFKLRYLKREREKEKQRNPDR